MLRNELIKKVLDFFADEDKKNVHFLKSRGLLFGQVKERKSTNIIFISLHLKS